MDFDLTLSDEHRCAALPHSRSNYDNFLLGIFRYYPLRIVILGVACSWPAYFVSNVECTMSYSLTLRAHDNPVPANTEVRVEQLELISPLAGLSVGATAQSLHWYKSCSPRYAKLLLLTSVDCLLLPNGMCWDRDVDGCWKSVVCATGVGQSLPN